MKFEFVCFFDTLDTWTRSGGVPEFVSFEQLFWGPPAPRKPKTFVLFYECPSKISKIFFITTHKPTTNARKWTPPDVPNMFLEISRYFEPIQISIAPPERSQRAFPSDYRPTKYLSLSSQHDHAQQALGTAYSRGPETMYIR